MGHQKLELDDDIAQANQAIFQSPVHTALLNAAHLIGTNVYLPLLFPPNNENMAMVSILINGHEILVSDIHNFYHTYTAIADPIETEARRRHILLTVEYTRSDIINEITPPVGSPFSQPSKQHITMMSEACSSKINLNGGKADPISPNTL